MGHCLRRATRGYDVAQIDVATVTLNDTVSAVTALIIGMTSPISNFHNKLNAPSFKTRLYLR